MLLIKKNFLLILFILCLLLSFASIYATYCGIARRNLTFPEVRTQTEYNNQDTRVYVQREPLKLASRDDSISVNAEMREALREIQEEIDSQQKDEQISPVYLEMEVPTSENANTGFKSYMSYRAITNQNSAQYKLQQEAITDENGFRMYDGCYMVALGTYYVDEIGEKFRITLDDGTEFYAIAGDVKSDLHTDPKHQHKNGNIVEFIVDSRKISDICKKMGDMSYAGFSGKILKIEKIIPADS